MVDAANVTKHLNDHQKYPASKDELVAECDNLSDFSQEDKDWFSKTLPQGTYNSAQEVLMALGI